MHGNKKLCRIFLGKCMVARYEILTTKKPPNLAMRGLFLWLFIQESFVLLVPVAPLALLQFVLEPVF
jgi:hypothetical protein